METGNFNNGAFRSDEYLIEFIEPLVERGFFPPLMSDTSIDDVRSTLRSHAFMNRGAAE